VISTRFKRAALIVFFSIALANCANATSDPSDTVRNYNQAVASGNYVAASRMFHPDGMAEQRSRLEFLFESGDENLVLFRVIFGEDAEPETVKAMTDQEFFEFLYVLLMEQATSKDWLDLHEYKVLGAVMEGEHTAHVLVKGGASTRGKSYDYVFVHTLHRVGERWVIERDTGVEAFVNTINARGELAK